MGILLRMITASKESYMHNLIQGHSEIERETRKKEINLQHFLNMIFKSKITILNWKILLQCGNTKVEGTNKDRKME